MNLSETEQLRQAALSKDETAKMALVDKMQEDGDVEKALEIMGRVICECVVPLDDTLKHEFCPADQLPPPGTYLTKSGCHKCGGTGFMKAKK